MAGKMARLPRRCISMEIQPQTQSLECRGDPATMGRSWVVVLQAALALCSMDTVGSVRLSTVGDPNSSAPIPTFVGCGKVTECRYLPTCGKCLAATLPYTNGLNKVDQLGFAEALLKEPACSPDVTSPETLRGVYNSMIDKFPSSCPGEQPTFLWPCQMANMHCSGEPECRGCMAALVEARENAQGDPHQGFKVDVLESPACNASSLMLRQVMDNCAGAVSGCSYYKFVCGQDSQCSRCWSMVATGSGSYAEAAALCTPHDHSGLLFNALVQECGASMPNCELASIRCDANANCSRCLEDMQHGQNARAIILGSQTEACQSTFVDDFTDGDGVRSLLLEWMLEACKPASEEITAQCATATTYCVSDRFCSECAMASELGDPLNDTCVALFQIYGIEDSCSGCSRVTQAINRLVLATTIVGAISVPLCLAVIITIVARGKQVTAMRDRILLGLMSSNTVYSIANIIPTNRVQTSLSKCGELSLSFETVRFGRAVWFGGKYALVFFEIVILLASIWTIRKGLRNLTRKCELTLMALCITAGCAAGLVFFVACAKINEDGFNQQSQQEASQSQQAATTRFNDEDDFDDDALINEAQAASTFSHGREEYNILVQRMLIVWNIHLALAIALWAYLKVSYRKASNLSAQAVAKTEEDEAADEWAATRRAEWRSKHKLLTFQRSAYDEVARPLEPFVAVFVLFGAPAILMSTDWCQIRSEVIETKSQSPSEVLERDLKYGTCDVWCELVLAFRTAATICVYLLSRTQRREFFRVRESWTLLWRRVFRTRHSVPYVELRTPPRPSQPALGDGRVPKFVIEENEVVFLQKLACGTHGEVWAGHWQRCRDTVAIKILFECGRCDVADEEFARECAVLQRLNHPGLIQFYGYGTLSNGCDFIVTEHVDLGGLDRVLQDKEAVLPWMNRLSIGLQVAQAMEYLHEIPIVHRDLKSPNILLSSEEIAKVCDFGSSTALRHRRPVVLYSAFTGACTMVEFPSVTSMVGAVERTPVDQLTIGFLDHDNTMTRAVGTLLWMAPEMFRGDISYGSAVDVYSFGIVLWEIAMREVPWMQIIKDVKDDRDVFRQMADALQNGRRPSVSLPTQRTMGDYVHVMERCWAGDPADRPNFSEVAAALAQCLRRVHSFPEQQ